MQLRIKTISGNPVNVLRRAGYAFQRREGEEMSFARAFSASGYPRFHMYVRLEGAGILINIHLDMKRETYGEDTRHHGEYENSQALSDEVMRLRTILE